MINPELAKKVSRLRAMYRGHLSLEGIATLYANDTEKEIKQKLAASKRFETGSCSESCEGFLDLFEAA